MTWSNDRDALLSIQDLKTWFPIKKGFLRTVVGHVKAVDGVDLAIPRGQTVGLVGESGCGKTTLGRTVLRLIQATSGRLIYRMNDTEVDLSALKAEELFRLRRHMQIIFQDPFSSLDPRMSVGDIVGEYLGIHKLPNRQERIVALLESVGLGSQYLYRYPHEFSGGQRQRIGIARALSLDPEFIVCDEPVSALDVSIQAQITNLLKQLQREKGLTYLFISHDLRVVEYMSDRVAVMYLGKVVEYSDARELYGHPLHPYSEALLSAIPSHHAGRQGRIVLEGDVPSPANPPAGCRFHPRCRYAEKICRTEPPALANMSETGLHRVACHLAGRLELKGLRRQG